MYLIAVPAWLFNTFLVASAAFLYVTLNLLTRYLWWRWVWPRTRREMDEALDDAS